MVSRKRNKGKERKAKQVETKRAAVRHIWQGWARDRENNAIITRCDHALGAAMISDFDDSHPVLIFMDDLFINWLEKSMEMTETVVDTLRHKQVWNDSCHRNIAIKLLLCIGTNLLLVHDVANGFREKMMINALFVAQVVVVIEKYEIAGEQINLVFQTSVAKLNHLYLGGVSRRRDLLKFFSKRIVCSCLKKMHLEARKSMPKMGSCYHCKVPKERASFMICSRCKVYQYCSKECQVANWPQHQGFCDMHVDAQEQLQKISAQMKA
jgi:hypothetical protein